MRAARVTVVVPCVCVCVCMCMYVCVSVRSFLPPRASRPRNIGTYVFTLARKNFYNRDFHEKCLVQKLWCNLLASNAYQLHLNPKRRIPKESAEGRKAIDSHDFN